MCLLVCVTYVNWSVKWQHNDNESVILKYCARKHVTAVARLTRSIEKQTEGRYCIATDEGAIDSMAHRLDKGWKINSPVKSIWLQIRARVFFRCGALRENFKLCYEQELTIYDTAIVWGAIVSENERAFLECLSDNRGDSWSIDPAIEEENSGARRVRIWQATSMDTSRDAIILRQARVLKDLFREDEVKNAVFRIAVLGAVLSNNIVIALSVVTRRGFYRSSNFDLVVGRWSENIFLIWSLHIQP